MSENGTTLNNLKSEEEEGERVGNAQEMQPLTSTTTTDSSVNVAGGEEDDRQQLGNKHSYWDWFDKLLYQVRHIFLGIFVIIVGMGILSMVAYKMIVSTELIVLIFDSPTIRPVPLVLPCATPACERAAERVSSIVETTINPCYNFYYFSCGEIAFKPTTAKLESSITATATGVAQKILQLLESPDGAVESEAVYKARQWYYSCLSASYSSSETEHHNFLSTFLPSIGLGQLNESNFHLETALAQAFAHNVDNVLKFSVAVNLKSAKYVMQFDKGEMVRKKRINETIEGILRSERAYKRFLMETIPTFSEVDVDGIIDFENKLSDLLIKYSKLQIDEFEVWARKEEVFTLAQMNEKYPEINWMELIQVLMKVLGQNLDMGLQQMQIQLPHPKYVSEISTLIGNTERTTLNNFLTSRFMWTYSHYLGRNYRKIHRQLKMEQLNSFNNAELEVLGHNDCLELVFDGFRNAMLHLYVQEHSIETEKNIVLEMFDYLKREFIPMLSNQTWMPVGMEEFKDKLVEKVRRMRIKVGYPKSIENITTLDDEYAQLHFSEHSFIQNVLTVHKFRLSKLVEYLQRSLGEEWIIPPSTTNAYHVYPRNEIVIPQGTLSYPMFDQDQPMYLNFANLGFIIAHEIVHGFDNRGRHHDQDGNLTNWWPEAVEKPFRNEATCLIQLYGKYKQYFGDYNNGVTTLSENICDNTALRLALAAYQTWAKEKNIVEPSLPVLGYTIPQIFYIVYSQGYCESISTVYNQNYLYLHSPGEFRVIGSVQNNADFGQHFNCPLGSPMNPGHKCSLWS